MARVVAGSRVGTPHRTCATQDKIDANDPTLTWRVQSVSLTNTWPVEVRNGALISYGPKRSKIILALPLTSARS